MAEIRVLGPLEIVGDEGAVALSAPMHRRLLAALLGPGVGYSSCTVVTLVAVSTIVSIGPS